MVPEKFVAGPFKGDLPCRVDDIGQGAERKTRRTRSKIWYDVGLDPASRRSV